MTGLPLGLIIEGLVAFLLLVTIGYCVVLNKRLVRMRVDEATLRATVDDLVRATDLAEKAIQGMKLQATQSDTMLSTRLDEAEKYASEITHLIETGKNVLHRLSVLADSRSALKALSSSSAAQARPQQASYPSAQQNNTRPVQRLASPSAHDKPLSDMSLRPSMPLETIDARPEAQQSSVKEPVRQERITSSAALSKPATVANSFKSRMQDIDRMAKAMMERSQKQQVI
jgi:urease gamma subunit